MRTCSILTRWLKIAVDLTVTVYSWPAWTHRHAARPLCALTEAGRAAGAAELRQTAGHRTDLLAEVAGLALGTSKSKGPEYRAQAQAIAELCRLAGADESLIPQWTEEGWRRAECRRMRPFSG